MKAIRAIVFILIILLVLFLLIAAFAPGKYEVTRSISIDEPVEEVFNYTANLHNYDSWNPWIQKETNAHSGVSGSGISVGSKYSWEGDTIGSGYMIIRELETGRKVIHDLYFTSPWEVNSENIISFNWNGETTEVTWTMKGSYGYPIERFIMLFSGMESNIGPDFEKGLANLKHRFPK